MSSMTLPTFGNQSETGKLLEASGVVLKVFKGQIGFSTRGRPRDGEAIREFNRRLQVAFRFSLNPGRQPGGRRFDPRTVHQEQRLRRGDGLRPHRTRHASVVNIERLQKALGHVTARGKTARDAHTPSLHPVVVARIERTPADFQIEIARRGVNGIPDRFRLQPLQPEMPERHIVRIDLPTCGMFRSRIGGHLACAHQGAKTLPKRGIASACKA